MRRQLISTLIVALNVAFQSQPVLAQQTQANTTEPVEVYVWGQQPTSAATEQTRWQKELELRPTNTPSDVLRLTPGLIIGQHHGGGKADQILFRGFDSDHGTDFAVFIDGIPVNMVSHAHVKDMQIYIGSSLKPSRKLKFTRDPTFLNSATSRPQAP